MTSNSTVDVLICGAGSAGLTLAIEMARRGVSFRLIEKMRAPFGGSRGKGIQPRTQEVFEDMGILDRVMAAGGRYPQQRIYREDGTHVDSDLIEQMVPTPAEPYHLPLMLPQHLTEHIMRERLNELGHRVDFSCELLAFEQDVDGVTAVIKGSEGKETVYARYLAGADGGRSFVRKALSVDFPGKSLGVRAIVADVALTGLERDAWHQFSLANPQSMVSICPLAGTDLFQIQAPILAASQADLSAAGLTTLIAERTGREDIIVHSVSWSSDYQMSARLAERYRVERVFLVGDAGHVHPPTGGQGLNTSIQDAYNLGWKLAAALKGAREGLLDSYEIERRPVAESVLGVSTQLLDDHKKGESRRGRELRQLDIGYPQSPLIKEMPERHNGIRAGNRAPDAPMLGAAGQSSRLFELFRGTHWTLLVYETRLETLRARPGLHIHHIGPAGDVIDAWNHIRNIYKLKPGECVLVRPDGYVGATFDAEHVTKIDEYLSELGMVPLADGTE